MSSSRSTAPCSSTSLARPGERISLSNPLALPVVKGPNVCVDAARLPDLLQIQSPRGCRTILIPQGSSALCTVGLPAFAECPEASRLPLLTSLLPPLPILFPRPTSRRLSLQGARLRRSSLCVVPKIRTHPPYTNRSMLRYHVSQMYAQCPCTMFSRQMS